MLTGNSHLILPRLRRAESLPTRLLYQLPHFAARAEQAVTVGDRRVV